MDHIDEPEPRISDVGRTTFGGDRLGTAAFRGFQHPAVAGAGGRAGRFSIPWPARLNPEVERMRRHSLEWARLLGIIADDDEERRLDAPRFDRLAAYAHPDARGLRAELVSDWMIWFFPFDDWYDGPIGEDPARVRAAVEPMIDYVYGNRSAVLLDAPPLVRGFCDLCGRSAMGMSARWRNRFAADVSRYLYSYVLEAVMRRRGATGGLEHLREVRRDAIGIRPSLAFGETAEGCEVAFPLALSQVLRDMRMLCADIVVVQNDVYSLDKDLAAGEMCNQAIELMRAPMSREEALGILERRHDELVARYCELEESTASMPGRYALPEQQTHVSRYAATMRSWISGNDAWSRETVRYPR